MEGKERERERENKGKWEEAPETDRKEKEL